MSLIDGGYMAHERADHQSSFQRGGAASPPAIARLARFPASDPAVGVMRRRARWIIPVVLAVCYALFALAVHLRILDPLDIAVRRESRPGDVWGPLQIRAAQIVHALQPARLALLLLLVVAVLSLLRRSFRPLVVVAVVGVPVAIVTLGTKYVMAHADPSTMPVGHGSFPSGHMVSIIIVLGLIVLLIRPRTTWGLILPALMGCLMGCALVLAAIHPATDVIGAGLLAIAALAIARAAGLGHWASDRQPRRVR